MWEVYKVVTIWGETCNRVSRLALTSLLHVVPRSYIIFIIFLPLLHTLDYLPLYKYFAGISPLPGGLTFTLSFWLPHRYMILLMSLLLLSALTFKQNHILQEKEVLEQCWLPVYPHIPDGLSDTVLKCEVLVLTREEWAKSLCTLRIQGSARTNPVKGLWMGKCGWYFSKQGPDLSIADLL